MWVPNIGLLSEKGTKCYQILKICHALPDLLVGRENTPSYLAPSLVASSGAVPNKIRSPGRKGIISSCCKLLHFHNQATLKYDNQGLSNTQNVFFCKLYKWSSWDGAETLSFVGVLPSILFHHWCKILPIRSLLGQIYSLQENERKQMASIWQCQAYRKTNDDWKFPKNGYHGILSDNYEVTFGGKFFWG